MIDTHAHIGGESYFEKALGKEPLVGTAEEYNEFLKEFDLEHGLVFHHAFTRYFDPESRDQQVMDTTGRMPTPYHEENRKVIDAAQDFARLHPVLEFSVGKHSNVEDVRELAERHSDITALKIHPKSSHSDLADVQGSGILKVAQEYNLPIISHLESDEWPNTADFDLRSYSSPEKLLKLAENNPDVLFQGAHLANFSESFLESASELDNLYVDCSPPVMLTNMEDHMASDALRLDYDNPVEVLNELVDKYPDTIVYGSDYPYMRKHNHVLEDEGEILNKISQKTFNQLEENAEELYSSLT